MKKDILIYKFKRALEAKKNKNYKKALETYNELYEELTKEAVSYAKGFDDAIKDSNKTRTVMPEYFARVKEHLSFDNAACTILNNMGVIFVEIGEKDMAIKSFQDSVDLTPYWLKYDDPINALKKLTA